MRLCENKTQETAIRFVGITVLLCALPALVSRVIYSTTFAVSAMRQGSINGPEPSVLLPGMVFSLTLCGASILLVLRTKWFLRLTSTTNQPAMIRLGDRQFWVCSLRAVGIAACLFGAAWFGHAVFRYRFQPSFLGPYSLAELRWQFVGAVFSIVFGIILATLPRTLGVFFHDAEVASGDGKILSDRRLLTDAIWTAVVFAVAFRLMWIARLSTWWMEGWLKEQPSFYQLRSLVGEAIGCAVCFSVLRCRSPLVRWFQPADFICPACGLDQSDVTNCPECDEPMLRNSADSNAFTVNRRASWRKSWSRIAALTMLGWVAAVAATRGSFMFSIATDSSGKLPDNWTSSFVMGAGAPMLFAASLVLFTIPGSFRQVSERDTLRAVGLRLTGLIMLMQTAYLSFLVTGYLLRAKTGPSSASFYPSGLVAAVQCFAAFLIACWLFRRSHIEFAAAQTDSSMG